MWENIQIKIQARSKTFAMQQKERLDDDEEKRDRNCL